MGDLGKAQANETKIAIQEAKVKEAQAKAAIAMAKATEAEEKAKAASVKASETKAKVDERAATAANKLAKESTKAAEAAKQQAEQAEKQNAILQRNKDILEFMTQGFSKGQSSQLAYAKATSATVDELKQLEGVLQNQRKLIGNDAFDSSIGGLIKLKNQYTEIKEAVRQYNNDIELSRNQTRELARDKERIIERMKMEGKSFSDIKNAIRAYNQEYVTTANAVNSLIKQEKEIERSHRESMNAVRNLAKEEERMAAVVQNLNLQTDSGSSISERAAVAMATYERNLRLAGIAGVDAAKKLDVYRKQQLLVVEAEEKRQKQYLTRAIIPQFSDIFVGLTTGQSPLTIMLQQLPQIQDLFTLTGVKAKDTSKVIGEAAVEMISRLKDTAIAVGGAVGSAFTIVATNMVNAAASSLTFGKGIENTRIELEKTYGVNSKVVQGFNLLSGSLIRATTLGLGFGAAIAGPVLIALFQTQKALTDLNKNLISSGANIGKTRDELLSMAKSMDITGASSNKILGVFSEIASTGKISADVMQEVARAAIALEKAGGKNTEDSIKQIAKAYEDPLKALSEYRIATGLVTQDEITRVDALVKMGNQIEAVDYAQRIMAQGLVEESKRMLAGLSPVEELWKDIKTAISDVWTEIVNLSNSEPIISSLKTVFQTVAVIVTEVYYGIVGMAQSIAGLAAAGSAAISDITSMDTNFTASKAVLGAIGDQDKAREAAYKNTIARIMQEGKYAREETTKTAKAQAEAAKANSDAEKGRIARNKALEDVNKWEEKTAKDRMTREQFINKSLEDRLKISKDLTDEDKKRIRAMAGTEWDDAQKKPKKSEGEKEAERLRKSYIKDLEKINEINSEAIGYQENYSKDQMKVLEIMQSPNFAKYSAEQRKRIAADAEAAIAQADLSEAQKLMNKLLGQADGLGSDYYENLRRIQALFDKGDSSFGSEDFEKAKKALYAATEQGKQYIAFLDRVKLKEQELSDARKSLEADRSSIYMSEAQAEILKSEQAFADKRLAVQRDYLAKVAEIQRSSVGTDPAKLQQLMEAETTNLQKALDNINFEQQTKSLREFSNEFKVIIEQMGMLGSSLEGAFGNVGKNVSASLNSFTKLAAVLERNQKQMSSFKGSEEDRAKAVRKNSTEELGYYADAAKAAKSMFGEKTAAAKAFGAIEKVLHVARLGMWIMENAEIVKSVATTLAADGAKQASALATMAVDGVAAVVKTLASLPFPFNVAAGAAVAAIVAGLIGGVGGSFSGNVSSSAPAYNEGKGTVFGDSSAKSSSLENSYELLKEANSLTQKYSPGMLMHLRNIDSNIGGLVNLLVRTGNVSTNNTAIKTGTTIGTDAMSSFLAEKTINMMAVIDPIQKIIPALGKAFSNIVGSIFGKVKVTNIGSGITAAAQSLQDIMQGQFQAQYFSDFKIKKSGLFGGSTKYRTVTSEADAELEQQLTAVFTSIYDSVLMGAKMLGSAESDVVAVLDAFVVDIGKVNLSGTSAEMQESLSAVFSAASDNITKAVFPGLEQFQKVGEGYFETLVRVASELETVNSIFDMLGIKLYALGIAGVDASQSLINLFGGISEFQSATSEYYDSFYTEEEKVAKMAEQLTSVFSDLGVQMPTMNGSLQESLNAYRDIVNALDLTDSAQQEMYYTLISVSDAFYQVAEAATSTTASVEQLLAGLYAQTRTNEDIANSIYSLQNQAAELRATYSDLVSGATGANSAMYQLTTEGMHPLEKAAYDEVLALQARIEAEKAAQQAAVAAAKAREDAERERLQNIQNAFNEFEKSINSQKSTIQDNINAWKELFNTLESAIDNLYGNVLSTSQASAEEGRKFISDAIRTATTTGVMPAASEVQSAIDAVMQGLDSSIFASKADADVARLKFAAELQALQNLVVPKISDAERQIKVLEDTYENAKNQLSTLISINSNVLSLSQAIYNLNAASGKNIQVPAYASGGSYAGGAAIVGDGGGPELINFRTPGTIYNASSTANMAENTAISAEALVELIQEVQMLRAEVRADVTHNSKTAKILDRVLLDGTSLAVTTTP